MSRKAIITIIAGVIAVVIIGVLAISSNGNNADSEQPQTSATTSKDPAEMTDEEFFASLPRRQADDPMAMGPVDAPVVLIEWADYRCPFCSIFTEQTLPQLQHYFDEGKVRFEFRDMPVFGDDSVYAAMAARAAGKQGLYHEYQLALYKALPDSGHPPVEESLVIKIAEEVGVPDMGKFKKDLNSDDLMKLVQNDYAEAKQLGITSVPMFVVGGQVLSGAQPLEAFETAVDQEIAKAERK